MVEHWFLKRLKEFAELPVFIQDKEKVSFSQFADLCEQHKKSLQSHGAAAGDIIAFKAEQTIQTFINFFSVASIGAIAYPYRDHSQLDLLKNNIHEYLLQENKKLHKQKGKGEKPVQISELRNRQHSGLILSTSGTTGNPKLVLHDFDLLLEKYLKLKTKNTTVLVFQTDHISGIETTLSIITAGGTVVFSPEINPVLVCELIERHKANLLACSPTFLRLLMLSNAHNQYDISSLQYINFGAERMPVPLFDQLKKALPNVTLRQAYGTTETSNIRTYPCEGTSLMNLGKEGVDYKIVHNELYLKASPSMLGYITPEKLPVENGWYYTADTVERAEDGFFRITGRKSDIINTGGEKVSPIEVEEVLLQIPGVIDAHVYGRPNIILGEMVVADIVVAETVNLEEFKKNLTNFCSKKLPQHKIPVKFFFKEKIGVNTRLKKTTH